MFLEMMWEPCDYLTKTNVVIACWGPRRRGRAAASSCWSEVIGLEAGNWLTPRDFAPDELRSPHGWPPLGAESQTTRSRPIASSRRRTRPGQPSTPGERVESHPFTMPRRVGAQPLGLKV